MSCTELLTIAIERRRVAVAAFAGLRLDYLQVRELSSIESEAGRTVQRFVAWATATFNPTRIAIESPPPTRADRRLYLHAVVRGTLTQSSAELVEVDPGQLRQHFTDLKLRTQREARAIADQLGPQLARYPEQPAAHDAVLIGIHVQMTDLLSSN
jgi:hypothetical protein